MSLIESLYYCIAECVFFSTMLTKQTQLLILLILVVGFPKMLGMVNASWLFVNSEVLSNSEK